MAYAFEAHYQFPSNNIFNRHKAQKVLNYRSRSSLSNTFLTTHQYEKNFRSLTLDHGEGIPSHRPIVCQGISVGRENINVNGHKLEIRDSHQSDNNGQVVNGNGVVNQEKKVSFSGLGTRQGARQRNSATLVLMRHGESMWNSLKLFTGDVDIPLTEKGVMEAIAGGKALSHIEFDVIFTSRLVRSKQTALIAMTQSQKMVVPVIVRGGYYGNGKTGDDNRLRLREAAAQALEHAECHMIPVYADQALNERCYGDLQGLNKVAAAEAYGEEMVQLWRRSHNTKPPRGESLLDTWQRCAGFFDETIEPRLKEGKNVLIVAHGNVLRCIISHISGLSIEEMLRLQVLTALPYTYCYDGSQFAECCVLPLLDPETNEPMKGEHRGLSSVRKKNLADSLI